MERLELRTNRDDIAPDVAEVTYTENTRDRVGLSPGRMIVEGPLELHWIYHVRASSSEVVPLKVLQVHDGRNTVNSTCGRALPEGQPLPAARNITGRLVLVCGQPQRVVRELSGVAHRLLPEPTVGVNHRLHPSLGLDALQELPRPSFQLLGAQPILQFNIQAPAAASLGRAPGSHTACRAAA